MNVKIFPSEICGSVTLPASKSVAHRAMIAAFLSGGKTELKGRLCGGDVNATMGILRALGAKICLSENGCAIDCSRVDPALFDKNRNLNPVFENIVKLNACESGSTFRFMLPVLSALNGRFEIAGEGRLPSRPIKSLIDALRKNGAEIKGESLPLIVSGGLESGAFETDGKVSSQFVTGILLALPVIGGGSVRASLASAAYVDITTDVLKAFGVTVKRDGESFLVNKKELYRSPGEFCVEGDWSSAGFFAVAGAVSGEVSMRGLNLNSIQGDKIVLDVLREAGAEIVLGGDGAVTVKKPRTGKLRAFYYDAENCPDTVPVMCVAAAAAEGTSEISGVDRLKFKESDRLDACMDMLTRFGVEVGYENGALYITGGRLTGAVIPAYNDHRMAMSAAVAALAADGVSVIKGAECADKSYPGFFEDLKSVGAKEEII